jgi:nicotinate-nucleotide pyrophosphorylase (carboxylating)
MFISPHVERLIELGLQEDQVSHDISSSAFFDTSLGRAKLVGKTDMVVAGLPVLERVYQKIDDTIVLEASVEDGEYLDSGEVLGYLKGPVVELLRGERLALNFLQRISGVATKTASYVEKLGDECDIRIVDTRKTLPGYRELDKYAVRQGGASNHRYNLSGGVMIKDNHIAAAGGSIKQAVETARQKAPPTLKIEVEVGTFEQLHESLEAGADIIMLDNMSTDNMEEAIDIIRSHPGDRVTIEASGQITTERLPELRDLDLDIVSVGALTHSAVAADISMRLGEEQS